MYENVEQQVTTKLLYDTCVGRYIWNQECKWCNTVEVDTVYQNSQKPEIRIPINGLFG